MESTEVSIQPQRWQHLSFSGCGFLCIYHAGVAAAIKEYAPQLLQNKILGASAGSIVATGLITNVCISHATSTILKVVSQARSRTMGPLHPEFDLLDVVRTELTAILPANAYKMCTGRLVISLTRWSDHKNVIVEEYDSNEDLIDAIMCSCFIPLYCGIYPPKYRGVQYIDGGVSDNQPKWGANTVTVSPFSGESDICPSDSDSASMMGIDFNGTSIRCTSRNMFRLMACLWPRSTEDLSKMCLQGFEDALRFLAKNGMAPCIRCLTITRLEGGTQTPEVFSDSDEKRGSVSSSSGNLAALLPPKPLRKRNSSSVLTRVRGDSECEACGEGDHKADVHVGHVFPSIMRKPFDEAVEAEKTMFDYVLSFRIVKFARTTLGVSKLPLDVFLVFAKNIYAYIEMISPTHWFMKKLQLLADFVLNEVNKQTSRYTNFQCHMSVTELDIDRSTTSNYYEEKEHEIELSVEAKQELDLLRARDKRRSRHRCKAAIPQRVSDPMAHGAYDDVDSFSHVVKQEAIYEFHYYDEDNKLRSFELFNMRPGQGARGTTPNTIDVVPEEDEDVEEDHSLVTFGPTRQESEEIDSGLSGVENQTPTTSFSKRDACCSPVREFSSNEGTSTTTPHTNLYNTIPPRGGAAAAKNRNAAAIRRNTMPNSSGMQRKQSKTHSLANAVSSDSDVDGTEKLFVPSRKAWRASHEMDGTPESEASATETP